MPARSERRNIEIKVRVADLDEVRRRALAAGARAEGSTRQIDTYFRVPRGRLKLRQVDDESCGSLIFYERPDLAGSRTSRYHLLNVDDAAALSEMLSSALTIDARVDKRRELLMLGATRIHLDHVASLGSFVELETVITDQPLEEAESEHAEVESLLGLDRFEVVPGSYRDLIRSRSAAEARCSYDLYL